MRVELRSLGARHPAAPADRPPVLEAIDLRIEAGEQVAVIGASGAGKTSLLQVMALAMAPATGDIAFDGTLAWSLARRDLQRLRGRLVLAPQVPPLPPRQRVVTSVLAGRLPTMGWWTSLRALVRPDDLPAAHAALVRFDLGEKLFDRVDRLSGGERQRVGLARLLVAPAKLWLVDEPLSALDPTRSRQAIDTLVVAARERGATLVASLHQVDIALASFTRVVGLHRGRVMFDLPTAEVTKPQLDRLYDATDGEPWGPVDTLPAPVEPMRPVPVAAPCR